MGFTVERDLFAPIPSKDVEGALTLASVVHGFGQHRTYQSVDMVEVTP